MRNRNRNEQPGTAALAMAVITEHPRQSLAAVMSVGAVSAIFINALFLQPMQHPAPLFAPKISTPAPVIQPSTPAPVRTIGPDATVFAPRPRPADAPAAAAPVSPPPAATRRDPIAELIAPRNETRSEPRRAAAAPVPMPIPSPAPQPAANPAVQRIAAAQRALTEFGYGQVKPTGVLGPETQAAIERFERERGLPTSGQLSDRVLRELSIVTGRKLD